MNASLPDADETRSQAMDPNWKPAEPEPDDSVERETPIAEAPNA